MAYYDKYSSVENLIQDEDLSITEKINLLEQWREDEEDLQRASDEGMLSSGRKSILKQVEKALISLQQDVSK